MPRIQRYRKYLSNGLLAYKLFQILARAGILIERYHYFVEPPVPRGFGGKSPNSVGYEYYEAGPADLEQIAALDPNDDPREEIRSSFVNGMRCFTLRHQGRIVAATWCNVHEINYDPCRRRLDPDEAYLFGTQTLYEYRGRNVAAILRTYLHDALAAEGRKRVYSYTDTLNRPAVRFKEKIGAHILFDGLLVRVFGVTLIDSPSNKPTAGAPPRS